MTTDPELEQILDDFAFELTSFKKDYPTKPVDKIFKQAAQAITRWAAKQELRGRCDEAKLAAAHNNSEYTSDYLEARIIRLQQELDDD